MTVSAASAVTAGHPAPALPGTVILPGDDGFDQARQAWNLAVD